MILSIEDLHVSIKAVLLLHLFSIEIAALEFHRTTIGPTRLDRLNNGTSVVTPVDTSRLVQGHDIVQNVFTQMDRGTVIRATILFASIAGLVLIYVTIKAAL
jgi:hypothetical protein